MADPPHVAPPPASPTTTFCQMRIPATAPVTQLISRAEVSDLFFSLDEMLTFNLVFLERLEQSLRSWSAAARLGAVLLEFAAFFRMYKSYCNVQSRRTTLLASLRQRPGFSALLAAQEAECGYPLESLLIKPIQRVPQYKMLLERLLAATPRAHADHADLERALALMAEVGQHRTQSRHLVAHLTRLAL